MMTEESPVIERPGDLPGVRPALAPTVFGSPAFCAELSQAQRQRDTTNVEYAMPSGVSPTLR